MNLCIVQGGPYYDVLHSLLGAYVCYQPEIGYVQGMSFIAAVLLLNMEEIDAFVCFANLLNKPCHKAFYSLDVRKVFFLINYTHLKNLSSTKAWCTMEICFRLLISPFIDQSINSDFIFDCSFFPLIN